MKEDNLIKNIQISKKNLYPLLYLSNITSVDQQLVRESVTQFRSNSKYYEDSWGYIIQAARYGGFKWYDPKYKTLIFFGRKSNNDSTLVIPTYFADFEYLSYVVDRVKKAFDAPKIILKNINLEDADSLIQCGFRLYRENEAWSKEAKYDDQTYPQLIIDLKKFCEAKGRAYRPLRKALNKNLNISIRKYNSNDKQQVLKLFFMKDDSYKNNLSGNSSRVYYESHCMYPDSDLDKFVTLNQAGKIVGFTATSDISSKITALVASIYSPEEKNISIWSMYQVLATKYQHGFNLASLGGSETKSTFEFKLEKFRPVEGLGKTHLVYDL